MSLFFALCDHEIEDHSGLGGRKSDANLYHTRRVGGRRKVTTWDFRGERERSAFGLRSLPSVGGPVLGKIFEDSAAEPAVNHAAMMNLF